MFERFSEQARQVVVLAQEEARTGGYSSIGTGHLLAGAVAAGAGAAEVLRTRFGVGLGEVRDALAAEQPATGAGRFDGQMPFRPEAKDALEASLRETLQLGHGPIRDEHLLLGLATQEDTTASRMLLRLGIAPGELRAAIEAALPEGEATPPPPERLRAWALTPAIGIAPGVVALERVLGEGDTAVVLLPELRVYPDGIEWPLIFVAVNDSVGVQFPLPFPAGHPQPPGPIEGRAPEPACELTLAYPGHSPVQLTFPVTNPGESGLRIGHVGGGGGPARWDQRYFVTPLAADGDITVVCSWPACGIPRTETRIDGDEVTRAAARARRFGTAAD